MRKRFLSALITLLMILIGAGYFIGDYFVDFALKRDDPSNPNSIPAACVNIHDSERHIPPTPDFDHDPWTITSDDDLKLRADYFKPSTQTHHWAILVHGYGRDRRYAYDYANEYLKHNWNVVIPDLRASGESEGVYLTMGARESDDIVRWINRIIEADPNAKIILHGVSMGAATVMLTTAKQLPHNVVAAVEDCGYTSAYEMFTVQLDKIFGLPESPIMPIVKVVSKIKTGTSIADAAPINAVSHTKIPMLFIHGDADKLVPIDMMNRLYERSSAPVKETMTFNGAGHADSMPLDTINYFNGVFNFLDQALIRNN